MTHDVFVSYSSKDKVVADSIVASMEKNGIRCWYAPRDINPGQSWAEAISEAIDQSRLFLIIFSENSNQSKQVLGEVNIAINDELIVLPFRIENLEPQGAMRLHLGPQHWLDAYDPSWESHIIKLVETVALNLNIHLKEPEAKKEEDTEERVKVDRKPKKKKIGLVAIGAIATIVAIFGIWFFGLREKNGSIAEIKPTLEAATPTLISTTNDENLSPTKTAANQISVEDQEWIQSKVGSNCQIIFSSNQNGVFQIFSMDVISQDLQRLTDFTQNAEHPIWNLSAEKIAFTVGQNKLYVMNSRGGNLIELSNDLNPSFLEEPVWSLNGNNIAYEVDRSIKVVRNIKNNWQVHNVQFWADVGEYMPSVAPDGSSIVFSANAFGDKDIFLGDHSLSGGFFNGSQTQLTSTKTDEIFPVFSPDGSKIAYVRNPTPGYNELMLMDSNGENQLNLEVRVKEGVKPDWSPNGEKIAIVSDNDGDDEIIVINDQGKAFSLTDNEINDYQPAWSPLGDLIAFVSDVDGNPEIYVTDLEESRIVQLTYNEANDFSPDWSPTCQ